ncbi:MAG TPA: class I SAM-dependent methyltransferase [Actinomycetota bacterium]|jgi:SAM-dependent methyltransferase|nr:class I SAM-dependent methyltransferase [Actinomycetota bacterium]
MTNDPRAVVRSGYNSLGSRYLEWTLTVDPVHRVTYMEQALEIVDPGATVVELGCGPCIPTGRLVAERRRYVGVDMSESQLALARKNVPSAHLVLADMSDVAFRVASVEAVLAFYSIIHVPRQDHERLFGAIFRWLRPGGIFAVNLVAGDNPGGFDTWIDDVRMYWSGFDAATNVELVHDAGFQILRNDVLTNFEDDQEVRFVWILGRKPAP